MIDRVRLFSWGGPVPPQVGTANASFGERRGILLAVEADGILGLGEAAPLPGLSRESVTDCAAVLRSIDWRSVDVPASVADVERGWGEAAELAACNAARFAFETALLSVAATRRSQPLSHLVALDAGLEPARAPIARSIYIGATNDPETVARARAAMSRGGKTLKLKRSAEPLQVTLRTLRTVRGVAGKGAALRLDANGSLEPDEVPAALEAYASVGVELIEEPCSGAALLSLGALAVPWFADESLADPNLAPKLLHHPHCAGFVVKPTLLGGFSSAVRITRHARERGLPVIVTHAFEGPVGLAACAELAIAVASCALPPGIDDHAAKRAFADWDVPQVPPDGASVEPSLRSGLGEPRDLGALVEVFQWTR
ncbi:MAG: hypothetical protein HOW73_01000 [Polyangiaceae bacterium]|nr:hypothetical protein [Polyangiaceae bacterium]